MSLFASAHDRVHGRRVEVLATRLAALLPPKARVLDVGAGDGRLASVISRKRPDVTIEGIDVFVRPDTKIPVTKFDGLKIPFPDRAFDVVMLVDVVHHSEDPVTLLRESARVTGQRLLIKDHNRDGFLADTTLRIMDWVGNARHGVDLPYHFWPKRRWDEVFRDLGLGVRDYAAELHLYPGPADLVFGRGLHFIASLAPSLRP